MVIKGDLASWDMVKTSLVCISRTETLHILILDFSCWEGQYSSCLINLLCPINVFLLVFLIVIIHRLKVIAEGGFCHVDRSLVCLLVD